MEITSKDGNMVVNFYPVKDWDGKKINNRMLKVLTFRGDTQKKMLITTHEFYHQVKSYVDVHKYLITDESMPAQFHNFRRLSYV
jgi:NifB/MoaA-like Fe-S oxidoreductase